MTTLHVGPGIDLPLNFVTQTAAILAMRGRGKTHLAKVIAEEMLKAKQQIIAMDPTGAWHGLASSASGKREGFPVVVFGGDHGVIQITPESGEVIADAVVYERLSAVIDLSAIEHDAPKTRFLARFAKRLYHLNRRPVHLFLDEADEFVPQNPQREQIDLLSILKRIWQRGRIKGIGGTLISQRSAVVHKTLLSQSSMLIALQTVSPQDRKALQLWFESWGNEEQIEEFTSTISNLPSHEAWFWSPDLNIFQRGKARKLETFDSSATPDMDVHAGPVRRAEIDVAKLGAKIKALAEEAKANDPEILKRENARLRMELGQAKAGESKRHGLHPIAAPKPVEKAVISPATMRQAAKAAKDMAKVIERSQAALQPVAAAVRQVTEGAELAAKALAAELAKVQNWQPFTKRDPFEHAQDRISKLADEGKIPRSKPESNGNMSGAKFRMLIALHQFLRLKERRWKIVAGIDSINTWRKYLGGLRSEGYVTTDGDGFSVLTPKGQSMIPHDVELLPTGDELIRYWSRRLGPGKLGDLFRSLAENPEREYTDEGLMLKAEVDSINTYRKYMGQLRSMDLADGNQLAKDLRP